jgi:predicted TIM-barrel fold metal-dependent hydrolase
MVRDPETGEDFWYVNGERTTNSVAASCVAGWDGPYPSHPLNLDECEPACWQAAPRLAVMDANSIWAQVLYPNVGGFGNGYFLRLGDRDLVLKCVQAYNDFLTDWCSVAPDRLVAITALPFWDVDLAVAELHRCIANGHRAVNFCNQPQDYGMPPLAHPHWDPVWAAAQEAGVSVSFHVGGGSMGTQFDDTAGMGWMTNFAKVSSLIFLDNIRSVVDLIFGGVCHRFPDLNLVSVESGVGWIPGMLETCDWQWRNGGVLDEHPEYDLLPSEYFARQIYGCFWFEEASAIEAINRFPDSILYETDYPHPTCQHPGPRTPAQRPRDYASRALGGLSDDLLEKVLHGNAARIYGLA